MKSHSENSFKSSSISDEDFLRKMLEEIDSVGEEALRFDLDLGCHH